MRTIASRSIGCLATVVLVLTYAGTPDQAESIGDEHFQRTWARTDQPVAADMIDRTWMWGPEPFSHAFQEPYVGAAGGTRLVQYFDKSRMEITHPEAVDDGVWYVTNGLLATELLTGALQRGDGAFEQHAPAEINLAGDPDDPEGITYAALAPAMSGLPGDPVYTAGQVIVHKLEWFEPRALRPVAHDELADYGATAAEFVPETGKWVAGPFWAFMNASGPVVENGQIVEDQLFVNPYYATGYPLTNPYWARVTVAGTPKDVLVQCFERRCLTFTPDNPEGWRVEAGNVGRHYYTWRYGDAQPGSRYEYVTSFGQSWVPTTVMGEARDVLVSGGEVLVLGQGWVDNTAVAHVQRYTTDGFFIEQWGDPGDEEGQFTDPQAIDQDSHGNLYVADTGNHRVQIFAPDGRFLTQWGPRGDFKPSDIAIGGHDEVYVLDYAHGWVSRYDTAGAVVGGWPVQGGAIAADIDGNLYVAGSAIRIYAPDGQLRAEWDVSGVEPRPESFLGIAVDRQGNVIVVDAPPMDGHRFFRLAPDGTLLASWDIGREVYFYRVTTDDSGNIWCALDGARYTTIGGVAEYSTTGALLENWSESWRGKISDPLGLAFDPQGNLLVSDDSDDYLLYDWTGAFTTRWTGTRNWGGRLSGAPDIDVGPDGSVYVLVTISMPQPANYFIDVSDIVRVESSTGGASSEWWPGITGTGMAVDDDGNVLVSGYIRVEVSDDGSGDTPAPRVPPPPPDFEIVWNGIRTFAPDGTLLDEWPINLSLTNADIAVAGDRIYAASDWVVYVLDRQGTLLDVWISSIGATDIAVGPDGSVFVASASSNSIVKFDSEGAIVATMTNVVDDAGATLNSIAVDQHGNLFVAAGRSWETGQSGEVRKYVPVP